MFFHGLKTTAACMLFFLAALNCFADSAKVIRSGSLLYAVNRDNGFEISADNGRNWEKRNSGLPARIVYPFDSSLIRNLTSLSVDPLDLSMLSVTTIDSLYISADSGHSWKKVPVSAPVKSTAYFTASSARGKNMLLGTSFSGVFESSDNGKTWKGVLPLMERLGRGAGFYDDISAVCYGRDATVFFAATGHTGEIFRVYSGQSGRKEVSEITVPEKVSSGSGISSMAYDIDTDTLNVYNNEKLYIYDVSSGRWEMNPGTVPWKEKTQDAGRIERQNAASGKRGIYLSAYNAVDSKIDRYFKFMRENNMNSLVVDFKDDNGFVTFGTQNRTASAVKAVRNIIDVKKLVSKASENNIYLIGRIVVFKDRQLYNYDSAAYASWDNGKGLPWGHSVKTGEDEFEQKEFWVDPYSSFVWDYNIAIAEELQSLGIDEIQFDYIRFPTDGDIEKITYRHRREGMGRSEALESFLKKAREKISVPISTDLYGFNAWYKKGNWNGQQIDMFADYVDVICPMFYPSHFPSRFMEKLGLHERAESIYREGTERAEKIAGDRSVIRPYVQAFLIGQERKLERPEYSRYLDMQIKGLYAAGSCGFTLWNASGSYYMVTESMAGFVKVGNGPEKSSGLPIYQ